MLALARKFRGAVELFFVLHFLACLPLSNFYVSVSVCVCCALYVVRCTLCVLREVVAVISIDSLNFAQVVMVSRNPVWSPLTAPRLGIGECV